MNSTTAAEPNATQLSLAPVSFKEAVREGTVTHKDGHHKPGNSRCGCTRTTPKGAYRDVTVRMPDGRLVHFYHQSPIAVEWGGRVRLSSCGYQTSTTKERLNRYSPNRVVQRDFVWYVQNDGDLVEFRDGMVLPDALE